MTAHWVARRCRFQDLSAFVLAGAVALAGSTGLAYGQNGKPTTTTPTQVEVVNKTVLIGNVTVRVTSRDAGASRTNFDVSPFSVVRLVVRNTGCEVSAITAGYAIVENLYFSHLDSSLQIGVDRVAQQRVYDIPGETLSVLIGNDADGDTCDYTITLYGRRN